MWKKEDLQVKYIKIKSKQDYDTVIKILEELNITQYELYKGEDYNKRYNSVFITDNYQYFLTESNYSDIPIQKFYDYLASKLLKVEDLVEGEIYFVNYDTADSRYINLSDGKEKIKFALAIDKKYFHSGKGTNCLGAKLYRLATPEEKKWLNVCIKQNNFIAKEDLHLYDDVTFKLKSPNISEYADYYECIKPYNGIDKVGMIYRYDKTNFYDKDNKLISFCSQDSINIKNWFKPSTKEAYEAQSKPKPKFEIGKWYEFDFSGKYYLKCSNLDSQYFYYDEGYSFHYKTIRDYKGQRHSIIDKPVKEVSIEEIQQYLPENHPDKIKPMEKNAFSKGDYIVQLHESHSDRYFKKNSCFKQRVNDTYLLPELDEIGSKTNGWEAIKFINKNSWRYATSEEIAEYNRLGKPYDVTTLNNKVEEWSAGTYLVIIKEGYCGINQSLTNYPKLPIGLVGEIYYNYKNSTTAIENNPVGSFLFEKELAKWFPTKEEAEAFAKTLKNTTQKVKENEYITLNESHIGKYVSLYYGNNFYDKVLVTKYKNERIELLNNCHSNADLHIDKSIFKYSLIFDDFEQVNRNCHNIKLLNIKEEICKKEISKEKLLEEAKKRYPIGCEVISTCGTKSTIKNHDFRFGLFGVTLNNIYYDNGNIKIYNANSKKWAEIVSLPKNNVTSIDSFEHSPITLSEAFQQEGLIDTTINKIQSVSVELYQPEELQLF